MPLSVSRVALVASAFALVACGGKKDDKADADAAPAETTVAAETTASEDTGIVIPDAPPNPLIAANAKKAATYMEENGAREAVRTLESGLQIETIEGEQKRFDLPGVAELFEPKASIQSIPGLEWWQRRTTKRVTS